WKRKNPIGTIRSRPGSQLDREADSILRGSHVSRNSIQLAGGTNDKPDSTLADSSVDGGADINNSVEQQPRRNSKGHVRINEDTVCIVSPDTQVTTAIIVDDEADEDAGEVQEAAPAPSPASKANGHSPLLPTDSSRRPGSQLDSSSLASPVAAPADMVEVQVCSATLNAAA
uniref:E3 ubiquitin protein ligase HECW2 n=1 Tax=Macrostomum lignano TaxID=282301 RepID=A0A1I8J153_9PLAT